MSFTVTPATLLSDIVMHDPSTVTVLGRFGIRLGVGDTTVNRICEERGIDPAFFTTILNTFIDADFEPSSGLTTLSVSDLVNYLSQTNAYYEHYQLPNIERHFGLLISKSGTNNNLGLMLRFFQEVKNQLLQRIATDREQRFPDIMSHADGTRHRVPTTSSHTGIDSVEDKIDDLVIMLVRHLQGDYDANLALAVLHAVVSLKKDITQNNRIRDRIMQPIHHALTRQ